MADQIESLRAEVAALRAELAEQRAVRDGTVNRRRLLTGLAGLGAAGAAGIAAARPAAATDGDPLMLGEENTSESPTSIEWGDPSEYPVGEEVDGVLMLGGGSSPALWARSSDVAVDVASGIYGVIAFGHGFGVVGRSDHFFGVHGEGTDYSNGVGGTAEKGAGLYGESAEGPALFLKPTDTAGPPLYTVFDSAGAIAVNPNGDVWLCTSVDPDPAWTRLLREDTASGRVIAIAPVRALDTRATNGRPPGSPVVPGQKKGPLKGGEAITLDLAGVSPIPASASGVVGNLTVVTPSYNGYLMAGPAGTTPTTSALNFNKGAIVANAFTSQINPTGLTIRGSGSATNTYDLVVDITAYIS